MTSRRSFFPVLAGFFGLPEFAMAQKKKPQVRVTVPNVSRQSVVSIVSDFFSRGDEAAKEKFEKLLGGAGDVTLIITTEFGDHIQVEVAPATKAQQERKPEAIIAVLDDSHHQRLMGTVAVTLERDYDLKDLVRQMANDFGICGRRA